jgi:hypothetical protein
MAQWLSKIKAIITFFFHNIYTKRTLKTAIFDLNFSQKQVENNDFLYKFEAKTQRI